MKITLYLKSFDKWLLDNPAISQEERQLIIDSLISYANGEEL